MESTKPAHPTLDGQPTEGQFICVGESYTFNIPAIENYQAVEQTEIGGGSNLLMAKLKSLSNIET